MHPSDNGNNSRYVSQTKVFNLENCNAIGTMIPLPKVDSDVVQAQKVIFENVWPSLTDEAAQTFPAFARLYNAVKKFNLPNFLGARITVPSELNLTQ